MGVDLPAYVGVGEGNKAKSYDHSQLQGRLKNQIFVLNGSVPRGFLTKKEGRNRFGLFHLFHNLPLLRVRK